ncbi:MAG: helix-turn-helix domain-containing protein [Pigmentiphaga sp.]|jgi:excisionase family DNA binding protein
MRDNPRDSHRAGSDRQVSGKATPAEITPLTVRIPTAVRMTGIGRSKLYELIAAGEIEIVKIGSVTLIPVASLQALIARHRK